MEKFGSKMKNILNDIKLNFTNGTSFTKLLYLNLGVFLLLKILISIGFLFKINDVSYFIEKFLALPSNTSELIRKPWTLITYMFVHTDIFHILFNMIWLHFGSKIFLQYFNGKQLISSYFLGGIFGGLIYLLSFNIFPVFSELAHTSTIIGASASVLAIFISIATYTPQFRIQFPFIGSIKIKYIALTLVLLDFLSISPMNPGGHIAHIGGALFGYLYIIILRRGIDISVNFYRFISYFQKSKLIRTHKKRSNTSNDSSYIKKKNQIQNKINSILEKISKSGYDSLSKEEKEILFKESK